MKPVKIIENLYLGDIATAKDFDILKKNNIVAIVNISAGKLCFPSEFIYLKIHIIDQDSHKKITEYIDEVTDFISKHIKNGGVLIHCKAGMSRSPSFIAAYLIKYKNFTIDSAIQLIKQNRPEIRPRQSFIDDIGEYFKLS